MKIINLNGDELFNAPHALSIREALETAVRAGADLTDANFIGADLACADLVGADLTGVDLTNADLTNANLVGADLARADLTHSTLCDADLRGAIVTFRGKCVRVQFKEYGRAAQEAKDKYDG